MASQPAFRRAAHVRKRAMIECDAHGGVAGRCGCQRFQSVGEVRRDDDRIQIGGARPDEVAARSSSSHGAPSPTPNNRHPAHALSDLDTSTAVMSTEVTSDAYPADDSTTSDAHAQSWSYAPTSWTTTTCAAPAHCVARPTAGPTPSGWLHHWLPTPVGRRGKRWLSSHATGTWASTNARSAEFVDSSTIHGDFAGQRFSAQVAREVLAKQAVHFWEHC